MVDITKPEERTKRLSLLDSFMPIGFIVGLPLGIYIKDNFGLVPLYSVASGCVLISIIYVFFIVKDSRKLENKESKEKNREEHTDIVLACNKGTQLFLLSL